MSYQSQIDAIDDILEKLNEKYGRNSCDKKAVKKDEVAKEEECGSCVYEPFEMNDPHLIVSSLCRIMRSRL